MDTSLSPDAVLQQQIHAIRELEEESDNGYVTAVNSSFLYGSRPPWGWDFILSFKMPKTLRTKLASTVCTPDNNGEDDNDDDEDDQTNVGCNSNPEVSEAGWWTRLRHRRRKRQAENNPNIGRKVGGNRYTELTKKRVEILARLKSAGFVFSQLAVPSENLILVRLSLPETRLKQKAVHIGLELKLKESYGSGFLAYQTEREQAYVNDDFRSEWNCYFSPSDRALIILAVLQSKEHWGCDLNLERLLYDQTILQAFALHSDSDRPKILKQAVWARWWDPTWKPPLTELKNYLGGKSYRGNKLYQ